jgi:serine/threonine protein kinase
MSQSEVQRAKREIEILKHLKHPNIAHLYDAIETETELLSYVLERRGLGEQDAKTFFLQILAAIAHCHSINIVHRDIKHQNILLDDNNVCKLIDFGLSNFMEEGKWRSTFCGTPAYAAPEMVRIESMHDYNFLLRSLEGSILDPKWTFGLWVYF